MSDSQKPLGYAICRRIHLGATFLLCLLAAVLSALTIPLYRRWSPEAVWFLGTGLGLLLLGLLNWSHIGLGPWQQQTARFVRWANWVFVLFGVGALVAVPMPQSFAIVAVVAQAVTAHWTLPGPT